MLVYQTKTPKSFLNESFYHANEARERLKEAYEALENLQDYHAGELQDYQLIEIDQIIQELLLSHHKLNEVLNLNY